MRLNVDLFVDLPSGLGITSVNIELTMSEVMLLASVCGVCMVSDDAALKGDCSIPLCMDDAASAFNKRMEYRFREAGQGLTRCVLTKWTVS